MSSVCIQLIVVAVTLSLSDVACQTVHNISISDDVRSGRQRRQAATPLTEQQISEIVQQHNMLRAREGAANMELMVWNTDLASLAATWVATCPYDQPSGRDYGQNVFVTHRILTNIAPAADSWYSEKQYYTFDNNECDKGKNCGYYTQVVWANSHQLGCAAHRCDRMTHVVCNYRSGGNVYYQSPYTKGPACSKCGNGAGWCKNKLCNTNCSRVGDDCWCAAICYNCAKLDLKTCRCKCAKGWHGVDCSERCKDRDKYCGTKTGWDSKDFCSDNYVERRCPAFCEVCEADPHAKEGQCPPVRGPAADSAQTMFIKSHQSTMIFVMMIIAFTISSYDAL